MLNFTLTEDDRRRLYEDEVKKLDHVITSSNDLTEVYYAHQQKQEYLKLLNRSKGA